MTDNQTSNQSPEIASRSAEAVAVQKPQASTPASPSLPQRPEGVTLATVALMCFFTAIIVLVLTAMGPRLAASAGFGQGLMGGQVFYVDYQRVVEAGIADASKKGFASVDDAGKKAEEFNAKIMAVLEGYKAQGYTVINSRALIVGAEAHDMTDEVLAELGVGQ